MTDSNVIQLSGAAVPSPGRGKSIKRRDRNSRTQWTDLQKAAMKWYEIQHIGFGARKTITHSISNT